MRYLVDGYNLLHALGLAPTPRAPSLEKARERFLEWLASELDRDVSDVRVVFDSRRRRVQEEHTYRGISMLFSRGETADDLIEKLIQSERFPHELTIVSNDHQIQQAARRHGCPAWMCSEFVDWLLDRKSASPQASIKPPGDKPDLPTDREVGQWLKQFGAEEER